MRDQTMQALCVAKQIGMLGLMGKCPNPSDRYNILYDFSNRISRDIPGWNFLDIGQLVRCLYLEHQLYLPTCPLFVVDLENNKQVCLSGFNCVCIPPQAHRCFWREGDQNAFRSRISFNLNENVFPFQACYYFTNINGRMSCSAIGKNSWCDCNPDMKKPCYSRAGADLQRMYFLREKIKLF